MISEINESKAYLNSYQKNISYLLDYWNIRIFCSYLQAPLEKNFPALTTSLKRSKNLVQYVALRRDARISPKTLSV